MACLPELAISFQGVDSDIQAAIQSVEEDFFGQHSSSSSDSSEACLPGYNLSTSNSELQMSFSQYVKVLGLKVNDFCNFCLIPFPSMYYSGVLKSCDKNEKDEINNFTLRALFIFNGPYIYIFCHFLILLESVCFFCYQAGGGRSCFRRCVIIT